MGYPDHLTCLLRNLYVGQEATIRTRHGTKDGFKIGKGVCHSHILSLCLFNFYAESIMQHERLDESQTSIKITGRNINKFRYADDTTLMVESEEELNSFLMKMKEESEKAGLNSTFKKRRSGIWSHYFMANRRGKTRTSDRFYFLELQNHCRW